MHISYYKNQDSRCKLFKIDSHVINADVKEIKSVK